MHLLSPYVLTAGYVLAMARDHALGRALRGESARGDAMTTRTHTHEEVFRGSQEEVFDLLCTPSAIRVWWSAARAIVLPEQGGVWAATWGESEDHPEYVTVATIREIDRPRRLVLADYRYRASSGPLPFSADFVTEFVVLAHEEGAVLRVTQDGFPSGPEADAFYAACGKGWRETFAGIRKLLEDRRSGARRGTASGTRPRPGDRETPPPSPASTRRLRRGP